MITTEQIDPHQQTSSDLLQTSDIIYVHTSMDDTAQINWLLTRRCNYKCSYCSVKDNTKGDFHNIGALKDAIKKLAFIKKDKLRFAITGGEPTIHPNYLEFLQHIFHTFGERAYVSTVSNLSMPLSFYEKLRSTLALHLINIDFLASYHFEFANKDRFLENVDYLTHNGISVMVQIMAHPEYMDTVKELYSCLVHMQTDKLTTDVKVIRDVHANLENIYTNQDLTWLKEYYKESEIKEMNVQLLKQDKKIEDLDLSANALVAHEKNCFKSFECYAGIEAICINANGDIDPATCFRKSKGQKPNIFRDMDPISFFQKPVICPFDKCNCLFDLHLSKIHPDYNKIVQRYNPNQNQFLICLEKKGWTRKSDLYFNSFDSVDFSNVIESPAVSIIVISWRLHPDNVKNFQILENQRDQNFELIFVDNGGKQGEFEPLKPYVDTYVRLKTNTGAYLARNVGAVFAKAPILIFLEDDGIPEHDFVEAHLRMHSKYDLIAVRGVYSPKTDTPLNKLASHYYLGDLPYPYPSNLEGNCSYRADVFYAVGGWDDEIVFGYGGRELSLRLLDVEPDQRKQIYSPEPVIYHDFATNEDHLLEKQKKQERSLKRLRTKYSRWDAVINSWNKYIRRYDLLIRRDLPYDIGKIEKSMKEGKHAEAITYLKGILSERPQDASVHNIMGSVFLRIGKKESALEHFKKAVELEPQNPTYQKNLAGIYVDMNNLREAIDVYLFVVKSYPEDIDSLTALATFLDLKGQSVKAGSFWEAILKLDPENSIVAKKVLEYEAHRFDNMGNSKSLLKIKACIPSIGTGPLFDLLSAYEEGKIDKSLRFLESYIQQLKEATV